MVRRIGSSQRWPYQDAPVTDQALEEPPCFVDSAFEEYRPSDRSHRATVRPSTLRICDFAFEIKILFGLSID